MSGRVSSSAIVPIILAAALAACGTTTETASETPAKQVVRSPIVADDATAPAAKAKRAKRRAKHATMAPIADPPERVARADDPVPAGGASTSSGGGPSGGTPVIAESGTTQPLSATPAETAPSDSAATATAEAPGEAAPAPTPMMPAPSDTLGTEIEPAPTVTAEATTPSGDSTVTPGLPLTLGELRDMMNAPVAGFPLWLMVLAGIVLAAALVFGTGGRPKREREEPTYDEPSYEEPRYSERDGEPEPA